jgi:hypothetical protein
MKKRIVTVIAAALALLTLTAVSNAAAPTVSGGVLVRTDGGYKITGPLRDADSKLLGTIQGTLTEQTTGFISCPWEGTAVTNCGFEEPPTLGVPPYNCNILAGNVTLNFRGTIYDAFVSSDVLGHFHSALCKDTDHAGSYELFLYMWTTSHVPPGEVSIIGLSATVQQISPTVWKWSQ